MKEKVYSTHEEALKEMDKMVKTKKNKGYTEDTKSVCISKTPKKETPSDIEETLNELQGDSSDPDENEEEKNKTLAKNFISNALGLSSKKVSTVASKEEDDDDKVMSIEDFNEDDEDDE